ncbi:ABC transporter periplasmic binding protein [Salmonella enterica subsp. enterica]|nr:ABC transporter periplasmic binding protein [Salmonella enterica subsp. enterica]
MDAGQRAAEVEGKGQKESGVRMFYTGWSASTGEADWALSPLFASQNWPPTQFNTAFLQQQAGRQRFGGGLKDQRSAGENTIVQRGAGYYLERVALDTVGGGEIGFCAQ